MLLLKRKCSHGNEWTWREKEKFIIEKICKTYGQDKLKVEKCVQVLMYIIKHHPRPDIYNVLKMLYFADKIHLPKYKKLIAPDKYVKLAYGSVPSLCYNILKYVRTGNDHYRCFDETIKEKIEVFNDDETLKNIRLSTKDNLTESDYYLLTEKNTECLDEAIVKYGKYDFGELKNLSDDEIYNSIPNINDEITIFDMAKVLDKSGELVKHLRDIYF
jgi:hypothetical protein